FTPDNDEYNNVFCIKYHGIIAESFLFNIYDRFGNLVYATDKIEKLECFLKPEPENGWDGKHYKTKRDLPMGVYVYEVSFQDLTEKKYQERAQLFIVR
ncbi:gliding motility-associated C-terminal domain-containing protein, partial [Flavobacteriales bacterium]|nr:gliding motility-associated C-terminal domain-containing protein [Flavobacteriales bacterium]